MGDFLNRFAKAAASTVEKQYDKYQHDLRDKCRAMSDDQLQRAYDNTTYDDVREAVEREMRRRHLI